MAGINSIIYVLSTLPPCVPLVASIRLIHGLSSSAGILLIAGVGVQSCFRGLLWFVHRLEYPNSVQFLYFYRWVSPWLLQAGGCTLTFHKLPKLLLSVSLYLTPHLATVGVLFPGSTLQKSVLGFCSVFGN